MLRPVPGGRSRDLKKPAVARCFPLGMVRPLSMNIVSPRRTPMFLHGYLRHQVGRCAVGLITIATLSGISTAQKYEQKNLVSDVPKLAVTLDPNLVNAWGIDFSATSPVWIADNG